jgi:capsular exopolysaccharide synthesis family protein
LSVENVIQHTDNSNLDVVVAGPIPPNPSELLLSKRMDELITELKSKYNFVILDSAPVAMVSDTFSLSKFANLVIYVTRANYTNKRLISYFNKLVEDKQLENVAMVLNDTDSKLSYGYGYGYGNEKDND